jgi:hypothetical protein
MTQLRVFSDSTGRLHLEISHSAVAYATRLSVPMLQPDEPALARINPALLVSVRFDNREFHVPFTAISPELLWNAGLIQVGLLDESDSRNILNNLVDIFAYG